MANLAEFSVGDLEAMNRDILRLGRDRASMVDAACDVTGYLYDNLLGDDGERACVTVRLYVTQPLSALPTELQDIGRSLAPDATDATACLTTIAHNGSPTLPPASLPEEHLLPFTDGLMASIPFIPNLLEQIGVDLASAVDPRRAIEVRLQHRTLNVYAATDLGEDEALLPNPVHRDIVRQRGIKSLVALAGVLPTGSMLMLILQARIEVPERAVFFLQPLGVAVKACMVPHALTIFGQRSGST